MPTIKGDYLIDTNILIYATLQDEPRAAQARGIIEHGRKRSCTAYTSVQNLAEMYPNLTGPKTQPSNTPQQAHAKIAALASLPYLNVLPVTASIIQRALELAEQHHVRRQKFFDMQLAATLLIHRIPTLVTENQNDFLGISEIRIIDPFD